MEEIYHRGGSLAFVGTLPDDVQRGKSGRIYLDDFSQKHCTPLYKFRNINDPDAVAAVRAANLDWLFIIGWSQIARNEILQSPRRGVLGIHPTLLPEGRGRASIPWAILKGLEKTGVTLFKLDEGVDTGPILAQIEIPIARTETARTLYDKVTTAHQALISAAWPALSEDAVELVPQDESRATLWPGRSPQDGEIYPSTMSVEEIDRHVRALTKPYPGAFVRLPGNAILRIWAGAPADHELVSHQPYAIAGMDGWYLPTEYEIQIAESPSC